MNYSTFVQQIDDRAVADAVARAEEQTSGEICVCIDRRPATDAMALAVKLFEKFGLHRTRQRNAVLILIAPESQTTAIIGDQEVDRRCGQALWTEVVGLLKEELPAGPTQAIIDAVGRVGQELAKHFPPSDDDIDELPNAPIYPTGTASP
jgi:uncharacterized membrane protein